METGGMVRKQLSGIVSTGRMVALRRSGMPADHEINFRIRLLPVPGCRGDRFGRTEGDMSMKFASNMLMVLLYAQGLLGFAGLTTVVLKDWAYSEPTFVHGLASVDTVSR
jgi:hypothetical protein